MKDIMLVQVMYCVQGLREEFEGLNFRKDVFGVLMIKQISMFCVLHDHVDMVILEQSVPKLDYVGVVHFQMQADLALDQFQLCL